MDPILVLTKFCKIQERPSRVLHCHNEVPHYLHILDNPQNMFIVPQKLSPLSLYTKLGGPSTAKIMFYFPHYVTLSSNVHLFMLALENIIMGYPNLMQIIYIYLSVLTIGWDIPWLYSQGPYEQMHIHSLIMLWTLYLSTNNICSIEI